MRRIAALPAAALLVAGGVVHLRLWDQGYRFIDNIGPLFLANVVVSALIAVALLVRPGPWVALSALVFSIGSLGALVASRTIGVLGFTEPVWTDDAWQALGAEVGAMVALAVMLTSLRQPRPVLIPAPVPA